MATQPPSKSDRPHSVSTKESPERKATLAIPLADQDLREYVAQLLKWQEESNQPDMMVGGLHRPRVD